MIKITVLRSAGAAALADQVLRHAADFGVLSFDPQEPQLSSVIVYSDELSFVVAAVASARRVPRRSAFGSWARKRSWRTMCPRPIATKSSIPSVNTKTPLHMDVELPTLQAIKRFVAMGNGVAFVPHISAETEIATGELVRIPVRELDLNRKTAAGVQEEGESLATPAQAFLKVAEAYAVERGGNYRFQRR